MEILVKIKNTKDYLVRPDKWWFEREIISRSLIYKKKYELAYKIASNHALTDGPEYAAAEWMSGWIALSFLDDPLLAKDHFENFYNNVGYPISTSRGAYWLAKTYQKLGKKELANEWFDKASNFLTTYYGQLAFIELNPNQPFELSKDIEVSKEYRDYFFKKELVKTIYLLDELNEDKYSKHILRHLANDNIDNGSEVLAAELATSIDRFDFAIQIAKIASYEKRFHNKYNYPIISTPNYINGRKIPDTAFILSIIRQESEFDLSANSHAGAKGLMQLMPATASFVARDRAYRGRKRHHLFEPALNLKLGQTYIELLLAEQHVENSLIRMLVAYNGGPGNLRKWLGKIDHQDDPFLLVESIPARETRYYVKNVVSNLGIYRNRFGQNAPELVGLAAGDGGHFVPSKAVDKTSID